jgi:hypothetical protein
MQVRSPEFKPSPTEERKERRRKGRREEGKEGERKKITFAVSEVGWYNKMVRKRTEALARTMLSVGLEASWGTLHY